MCGHNRSVMITPAGCVAPDALKTCRKVWYELKLAAGQGAVTPAARCSHTATRVGWQMYIIGGGAVVEPPSGNRDCVFQHFGDVPILDVRSCQWTLALGSADSPFPARRGHSAALHAPSSSIIVWGGTRGGTGQQGCLDDTWQLTNVGGAPAELRWEQPHTCGTPPSARRGHRAVVCADLMLVVGGYGDGLLFTLEIGRSWCWSQVELTGPKPWQYALFGCTMLHGTLLCFGGHEMYFEAELTETDVAEVQHSWRAFEDGFVHSLHSNTLHAVDISTLFVGASACGGGAVDEAVEEAVEGSGATSAFGSAELGSGKGGARLSRGVSPARTLRWQQLSAHGTPPCPRYCLEMAELGISGHQIVIFGGTDTEGAALNDTFVLHVSRPAELLQGAHLEWEAVTVGQPSRTKEDSTSQGSGSLNDKLDAAPEAAPEEATGTEAAAEAHAASLAAHVPRAAAMPAARNAMSLVAFGSRFLLFGGGIFARRYYSDLWCFELHTEPTLPPPSNFITKHLSPHLASLVGSERFADVSFRLPDGSSVPAHRALLGSGASAYMAALLSGGFREGQLRQHGGAADGAPLALTLPGEGWTRDTLLLVLRFLYTGEVPAALQEHATDSDALMALLVAADAIELEPLRALCESKLAQAVDEAQALEVLILADGMHCPRLRDFCLAYLQQRFGAVRRCAVALPPKDVRTLSGYDRLPRELLEEVHWAVCGHSHGQAGDDLTTGS
jgi:hypothetical protein